MVQHLAADALPPVRPQAAQRHDVQLASAARGVQAAAHAAHHHVVVVGWKYCNIFIIPMFGYVYILHVFMAHHHMAHHHQVYISFHIY